MRRVVGLVFAVLFACAAVGVASGANPGNDSASGHGEIPGSFYLDFSAKGTAAGLNASGKATLINSTCDPNCRTSDRKSVV